MTLYTDTLLKGKPLNKLSSWQARRKLAKLKQTAEHVLWFSEQLGLTATEVVFENTASQSLTAELNGKTSSIRNPPYSKEKDTLLQVYANNNNNKNNTTWPCLVHIDVWSTNTCTFFALTMY